MSDGSTRFMYSRGRGTDGYVVPRGKTGISHTRKLTTTPASASKARVQREMRARTSERYRLRAADGRYVHFAVARDAAGDLLLVQSRADAWIGTAEQLRRLHDLTPETRAFSVVAVPRDAGGVVLAVWSRK